jgi:hypothetical protein
MIREFMIPTISGIASGVFLRLIENWKGSEMAQVAIDYWPWLAAIVVFLLVWLVQILRRVERVLGGGIFVEPEREGAKRWKFKDFQEMTLEGRQKKFSENRDIAEWYRMEEWWHRRILMAQRTGKNQP